ncbi:uncharacterized protein TrAFT101_008808 [Trichoderma asperellum]|uniref:uncharacterized protein n=1 Tax=Trichoderma asperellum TaxID=101201 RepID=UPI003325302C|nr:hypothetical protein TrAFT101_008808 [Trichoderma asperellum]
MKRDVIAIVVVRSESRQGAVLNYTLPGSGPSFPILEHGRLLCGFSNQEASKLHMLAHPILLHQVPDITSTSLSDKIWSLQALGKVGHPTSIWRGPSTSYLYEAYMRADDSRTIDYTHIDVEPH